MSAGWLRVRSETWLCQITEDDPPRPGIWYTFPALIGTAVDSQLLNSSVPQNRRSRSHIVYVPMNTQHLKADIWGAQEGRTCLAVWTAVCRTPARKRRIRTPPWHQSGRLSHTTGAPYLPKDKQMWHDWAAELWRHMCLALPCKPAPLQQSRWSRSGLRAGAVRPDGRQHPGFHTQSGHDLGRCCGRTNSRQGRNDSLHTQTHAGKHTKRCVEFTHNSVLLSTACRILGNGKVDSGWEVQHCFPQTIMFIFPKGVME